MLYKDILDYINSFINFEKISKYQYADAFKLERMNAILEELGNPHKGLDVFHVAGSKGKGSTCVIAAYILKEAGYKVGLYTSPHLIDIRERIRVLDGSRLKASLGFARDRQCSRQISQSFSLQLLAFSSFEGMIGEEEIEDILEEIKPVAEKFREHEQFDKVSFFEILTACAFLYFKKKHVDAAVMETGLGGRLDATNVVMPLACGITNLSLEHTDKLGDTLAKIAYEKAGIIKAQGSRLKAEGGNGEDGGVVVSASQEKEARDVIRKVCKEKNAKLYEIGKDIQYSIVSSNESGQVFDIKGPGYVYRDLEINLIGSHQIENASLGIGMLKAIEQDRFDITEDNVRDGLKKASWPGRLEIVQREPYIILDGAHNPASMMALVSSVKKVFKYKKLICVFGISSDKDIKGVSSILHQASDIIILTKAKNNPRALNMNELKKFFQDPRHGIDEGDDISQAVQKALKLADKEDLILITGSLFLVGDAMQQLDTSCIA